MFVFSADISTILQRETRKTESSQALHSKISPMIGHVRPAVSAKNTLRCGNKPHLFLFLSSDVAALVNPDKFGGIVATRLSLRKDSLKEILIRNRST